MKIKFSIFIICMVAIFKVNAQEENPDKKNEKADSTYSIVQIPASFTGGAPAWRKYLQNNLDVSLGTKYIQIPKGQKSAKVTVIVSFIIDKEGKVSEVKLHDAEPDHIPYIFIKEAIRIIQTGPKWVPAVQYGRLVKYRMLQPISWVVSE